jgi:glycine hydroxymethyltransferase
MKWALGADHGGFGLKEHLKGVLRARGIEVEDFGCADTGSCDYTDFANTVAAAVTTGRAAQGLLVCTTGQGMSMAANKYPNVRAALCLTPEMAASTKSHNDANILVLAEKFTSPEQAETIVDAWLNAKPDTAERHHRRIVKMGGSGVTDPLEIASADPELYSVMNQERTRQAETIDLIASENYSSRAVREAQGSLLTNKYAEGYPGKRWYNGCHWVDEVEKLAIERAKALFGAEHANVQPHSGSGANMAVYFALLQPGDAILAMRLDQGGHLTHGSAVNFSGRLFRVSHYGVSPKIELIDYDEIEKLAREKKPRLLVAGASAYPRLLDFPRLREIADSVGALLMVDMAHIAGLVAGGAHPNPVPYCDVVTSTTHKTLRGPRSGLVLCREKYAADIDKQVFPGIQGGPLMHVVAAKAVCFHEAAQPAFKAYINQVVANSRLLARRLAESGLRIVSGGTDNHLLLVDLTSTGLSGKDAANALEKAGVTCNKNSIPFDTKSPFLTSGIRLGTAAVTTRGMKEAEMDVIARLIEEGLRHAHDERALAVLRKDALALTARFPID